MKKAQGLPMNIIVIAVIVLIVLVVLIFIFTGRINLFSKGLETCTRGTCKLECDEDTELPLAKKCKTSTGVDGNYCCVTINPTTGST